MKENSIKSTEDNKKAPPKVSVSSKLKELVSDGRKYKQRFFLSAVTSFTCAFSFVLYAVIDLFIANKSNFSFGLGTFLPYIFVAFFIIFVAMSLLTSLAKGRIYDGIICLIIGLTLAGYVQGNFLNISFGQLTGDSIPWQNYTVHAIINSIVWVVIVSIPFIIRFFVGTEMWVSFVLLLSVFLVIMQSSELIFTFSKGDAFEKKPSDIFLSDKGLYEVSSKENIIVFIVDRLDGKYVDNVFLEDSNFFEKFDGFTYYNNSVSTYCRTFPAVTYLFSGNHYLYDYPAKEYLDKVWDKPEFIETLKQNDFNTKLYMSNGFTYSDINQLVGIADNVVEGKTQFNSKVAIKEFLGLSAYRYAPHALKPSFWVTNENFNNLIESDGKYSAFADDDFVFYDGLKDKGLSLTDDKNNFMFYHLNGSHAPYNMGENVEKIEDGNANVMTQTKGSFNLIYEYIAQMKELGVYDSSTIIIMGDHGVSEDFVRVTDFKTTGFFIKPKGVSNVAFETTETPFSHEYFRGTVLDAAGISSPLTENSVLKLDEGSDVVRKFYYRLSNRDNLFGFVQEFEIKGHAKDFSNWSLIKEHKVLFPYA